MLDKEKKKVEGCGVSAERYCILMSHMLQLNRSNVISQHKEAAMKSCQIIKEIRSYLLQYKYG